MTIGPAGLNFTNPLTSIQSTLSGASNNNKDATLNVYAANLATAVTSTVKAVHIYDARNSSTNTIDKIGLDIDLASTWTGTGASAIGLSVTAAGGTNNYATLTEGDNVHQVTNAGGTERTRRLKRSEVKTCTSGGTCTGTSTTQIPAGATLFSVTTRVTEAVVGCTSLDIGDGTTANAFSNDTSINLDTTTTGSNYLAATTVPKVYLSAASIVITCNGGGTFSSGNIRITVTYELSDAATA